MIWMNRTLAVLGVSFGVAFLWIPFPRAIETEATQAVVKIEVEAAPYTLERARAEFGDSIVELSYENLESTPGFREGILGVWGENASRCFPRPEWVSFLESRSLASADGSVFTFRDALHRVIETADFDDPDEGPLACFEVEHASITISQPSSVARKDRILAAFREHIPDGLDHLLDVGDEW